MRWLICIFLLLSGPALARSDAACEELWFARNAMANSAGYCFTSPLGQAIFDNSDCTTRSPDIGAQATMIVSRILKQEAELSCRVDTDLSEFQTITWPDDRRLELRSRLNLDIQPPEPAEAINQFSCLDRVGTDELIFAAPNRDARVIGAWQPGGDLTFQHGINLQDGTLASLWDIFLEEGSYPGKRGWVFGRVQNDSDAAAQVGWLFLPHTDYLAPAETGGVCGRMVG